MRSEIKAFKLASPTEKYSSNPLNFTFRIKGATQHCLVLPIEVYAGEVSTSGEIKLSNSIVIFYLGFTISEGDLISIFSETNDRLKFIELVSFIVISVICLFSGFIVVRYTYMISYSFENPIITMSRLMSEIDPDHVDQED